VAGKLDIQRQDDRVAATCSASVSWRYTIEVSRFEVRLRGWLLWRSVLFSQADHGSFSRSLHFLLTKLKRPTDVARLITMQGKHTWTAPERQRARDFANSLPEGRLESARAKARLPSASVDELVRSFSDDREQLSRLLFVFDVNKPDLARFFRQLKPSTDVLSMTTLNSKKKEELCAWFEAYLSQVCRVSEFWYNLRLSGVEITQSQFCHLSNAVLLCKVSCLPCQLTRLRALQLLVAGLEVFSQKRFDRIRQAA